MSAGNHAIAVAYAARVTGSTAKVVMPKTASPFRVAKCRELGAEVELVDDVHVAFDRVKQNPSARRAARSCIPSKGRARRWARPRSASS